MSAALFTQSASASGGLGDLVTMRKCRAPDKATRIQDVCCIFLCIYFAYCYPSAMNQSPTSPMVSCGQLFMSAQVNCYSWNPKIRPEGILRSRRPGTTALRVILLVICLVLDCQSGTEYQLTRIQSLALTASASLHAIRERERERSGIAASLRELLIKQAFLSFCVGFFFSQPSPKRSAMLVR